MNLPQLRTLLLAFVVCSPAGEVAPQTRNLSLKDCIELALQNNLELEISRINPDLARFNLELSRTAYDPTVRISSDLSTASTPGGVDEQSRTFLATETDSQIFSSDFGGLAPSGLSYNLNANLSHREGLNAGGLFENSFGSTSLSLRQPLLRNAWIDSTRTTIRINRNNLRISELGLRQVIMSLVTQVERSYYDLILARNNVGVQEEAVELTERLLKANRRRVQVGLMAPLDEKQAESQVATRQSSLRSAQRLLVAQAYALKRLLTADIAGWQTVEIIPADSLVLVLQAFDLQASWGLALNKRPEILQSRLNLESDGITLKYRKNQLFPQLDLVASGGFSGSRREYSGALDDLTSGERPRYGFGAVVSIPLGNRSARTQYEQQKTRNRQGVLRLKELEQTIMTEVALNIEQARTVFDQVTTTRKAREFAGIALQAEEKKLEIGKSTSFIVLQLQRDLTTARSAEITALADYRKALATLAFSEGTVLERMKLYLEVK